MGRAWIGLVWSAMLALGIAPPLAADQQDPRLDALFAQLHAPSSQAQARGTEQRIWRIWAQSDDARVDRLMREGVQAMAAEQLALALSVFDRMVELAPDFAEAWNKRATVHYLMDDYPASVADIERTLELEPRHFGALSGLGLIYDAIGEPAAALRSFEAALALNPRLVRVRQRIETLRRELRGRPT